MRTLSLISDTASPCGVEGFARGLAYHMARHSTAAAHTTFPLTAQPGEILVLRRALAGKDALIVNLPVVAWKKRLLTPARAMAAARRLGKSVILVLHEWADLDWKRRATYLAYLPLATRILFSSPLVARQFAADPASRLATGHRGLVPIPANLAYPDALPATALAEKISAIKGTGKLILGHFGAIYPKKQSTAVLDITAALKANGQPTHAVFIGSFIGGSTIDPRVAFDARIASLGLADDVTISGYIGPSAEVFAAMEACDVLVYQLAEGLTSRRGSVLACLQTSKPVIVNGPAHTGEFDHHLAFSAAITSGRLILLAPDATANDFAQAIISRDTGASGQRLAFNAAWDDVVAAVMRSSGTPAHRMALAN